MHIAKLEGFILDICHNDAIDKEMTSQLTASTVASKDNTSSLGFVQRNEGVIISISVSIFIFFLGFLINEAIHRYNKSTKLNQYKQFIKEWIEKSQSSLDKYIESLCNFSKDISTNTDLNIAKWKTSIIHVSKINDIPLERYAEIFLFGLKKTDYNDNRKQLMNLLYQIEYLEKFPIVIKEVYDKYCEENQRIMDEWNLSYMQLNDLFQEYTNVDEATFDGQKIIEIMRLFIPLLKESATGNFIGTGVWLSKFIAPSLLILSDPQCSFSPLLLQVIRLVKSLRIAIIKHDKLNEYSEVFNEYAKILTKAKDIINESIEHFDGKKINRFCI